MKNKMKKLVMMLLAICVIGADAFSGLDITSIKIPEGVKYIEEGSFYNCNKLKKVTLPSSVVYFSAAFMDCSNLKTVNILSTESIDFGEMAFSGCKNLKTITIHSAKLKKKDVGSTVLEGTSKKLVIKAPAEVVEKYQKIFRKAGNKKVVVKAISN